MRNETPIPVTADDARAAAGNVIARGLPCGSCGYNLRTLRLDARCPECGQGVADSVAQWQQRWRDVLAPRRRLLLQGGAIMFVLVGFAAQFLTMRYRPAQQAALMMVVLAGIALTMVTAVRWDDAGGRRNYRIPRDLWISSPALIFSRFGASPASRRAAKSA